MEELKYLGTALTNQNSIQEEYKSRLKSRRGEVYRGFLWGNLRERDHLEDPGVDGRIILRWIFRKWDEGAWSGFSWLGIGTGGGHL